MVAPSVNRHLLDPLELKDRFLDTRVMPSNSIIILQCVHGQVQNAVAPIYPFCTKHF